MDVSGTETLTIIVTDNDEDDETQQDIEEYQDESESPTKDRQILNEISNPKVSLNSVKQLLQSSSSGTFKLGSASVKLVSKPNVQSQSSRESAEENDYRVSTKRKLHFDDFDESDLDSPKKAKIIWTLAKHEIDIRDARIDLLEKNNAKLTAKIYDMKDLRTMKKKNYILNQEVMALRQLLDLKNFHKALGDVLDM